MTVKELGDILKSMPQDALVICDLYSDYVRVEPNDITLMNGKKDFEEKGEGLINHNGHLMDLPKSWLPNWEKYRRDPKPDPPVFVTAVHFKGN